MYLKYVQIINYKNFPSSKLSFSEGANTVIGENDAGKSNAMTAIRILLDNTLFYNAKRLKESDFSYSLEDWKGHWIIISAFFDKITPENKQNEVCAELIPAEENASFLKSYLKCKDGDFGIVTLFIRPQKSLRKKLSDATDKQEFDTIRSTITLSDYEFYFTSRSQADFTNPETYRTIVGDFDEGVYASPDKDDASILGAKLNITDVQDHISIVFIDALRDVATELHKPRNPIRRVVEALEANISSADIETIRDNISKLNLSISNVRQIQEVGRSINKKLTDMIGMVYSPEIVLQSQLHDDISSLARYLSMKPSDQNDIELLGLGHLNIIYMALKLVEFEFSKTRELINIMIVEEPEAHIHTHIQKTLFDNLNVSPNYTQVIMTTHSTHISEVSEIKRVNVMKSCGNYSVVMRPTNGLDLFGKTQLSLSSLSLSKCIERYLDAKRSVLLFSKGVILVEGDGEEILIPAMVKNAFGISLDELGVGIINIGSTAFEYIACLYDDSRIQRYCSILTDSDVQIVDKTSTYYKAEAEKKGLERQKKLERLFDMNPWVKTFFAPNTFEVEFAKESDNHKYIERIIDLDYSQAAAISNHKAAIKAGGSAQGETMLNLANRLGKGWLATLLAGEIDGLVSIPDYILQAIMFASKELLSDKILCKMILYSAGLYPDDKAKVFSDKLKQGSTHINIINEFCKVYPDDIVSRFISFR